MIIIQDSRETNPLSFKRSYIDMVVRSKLDYGDYSAHCDGQVCPVYFERKELGDLFNTLSSGYDRFKKEINRCTQDGSYLIIAIEEPYNKVERGYQYSTRSGRSIQTQLHTLLHKHHIPFICFNSRSSMANYISDFYYGYFKNLSNIRKSNETTNKKRKADC